MLNKEYIDKIKELKAKTNAIILAHYYVNPEIQEKRYKFYENQRNSSRI